MNLNGLRQNVVKHFYQAVYLNASGETLKRCISSESPDAAMMLARSIASDESLSLVSVEPVNDPSKK